MVSPGALTIIVDQDFLHHLAHYALLSGNLASRVDRLQGKFLSQLIINCEHTALKPPEAFNWVDRVGHIHPGLMVFELSAPGEEPFERDVNWYPEIERQIRPRRKAVDLPHPS